MKRNNIFVYPMWLVGGCIFLLYITQMWYLTKTKEGMVSSGILAKEDAFCEVHRGKSGMLNESCGKLTQENCTSTSCCVWASPGKCMAGGIKGPTFNTDKHGKTNQLDYYYYQNKCYGSKC